MRRAHVGKESTRGVTNCDARKEILYVKRTIENLPSYQYESNGKSNLGHLTRGRQGCSSMQKVELSYIAFYKKHSAQWGC